MDFSVMLILIKVIVTWVQMYKLTMISLHTSHLRTVHCLGGGTHCSHLEKGRQGGFLCPWSHTVVWLLCLDEGFGVRIPYPGLHSGLGCVQSFQKGAWDYRHAWSVRSWETYLFPRIPGVGNAWVLDSISNSMGGGSDLVHLLSGKWGKRVSILYLIR